MQRIHWRGQDVKKFKQLFGILCFGIVLTSFFYGIKRLEKAEVSHIKEKTLRKTSHENSDVYAWVTVGGTKIDYPIVQHPTDDSYYLHHDVQQQETEYGAIFTEKVQTKSLNDLVTIVYGHAMIDDSMFGSLDYLANAKNFELYRTVDILTDDSSYSYDIIAAYTYNDDHLYHTFQLGDEKQVERYVSQLERLAHENGGFYRGATFNVERDKLLILSTCDTTDGKRFVVHAIRKGEI